MYCREGDTTLGDSNSLKYSKMELANAVRYCWGTQTCRCYRCGSIISAKWTIQAKSQIQSDEEDKECPSETCSGRKNDKRFMVPGRHNHVRSTISGRHDVKVQFSASLKESKDRLVRRAEGQRFVVVEGI